ncbi:hypothetical protein XENTR_v10005809 [Xenopus tropicalis]|nr:hypothetical protein XENTR_v10005809 [Xenopus tropicalis]
MYIIHVCSCLLVRHISHFSLLQQITLYSQTQCLMFHFTHNILYVPCPKIFNPTINFHISQIFFKPPMFL